MEQGGRIHFIKAIRDVFPGIGLLEAKKFCDAHFAELNLLNSNWILLERIQRVLENRDLSVNSKVRQITDLVDGDEG